MIVVFIASFFCVLNLCLWVAFFIKFKKIFSTEDIIDSTRNELNRMIEDINRNADRNINLIQDKIKQLKIAVAEADRHVELARREIEAQKAKVSYQQKIDSAINSRKTSQSGGDFAGSGRAAQQYLRNQNISAGLQSANSYELTDEGNRHVHSHLSQGDLFEQAEDEDRRSIVSDSGTKFTVEADGSSYASVPVIGGNVSYADDPIQPKKSFSQLVRNLNMAGHSVEEIARELDSSITEVQLVLDMDLGF
ncbi:hypothetical protein [uncultured Treponema sp.]|uniref:hypothetical protein n=2 Tax=Treponema TaxID=157 RepID=UPI0025EAC2B3|nr:hypothetical protein [uncultured Treponema sp.]